MSGIEEIKSKIRSFKRQYYKRQLFLGSLLFLIVSSGLFLLVNSIEYQLWLSSTVRSIVFFLSLASILTLLVWFVALPLSLLLKLRREMSDREAALEISRSFPEIEDKLINTLQLSELSSKDNLLVQAAIDKKAVDLHPISFIQAVDFSAAKRYGMILGGIMLCLVLVSFINPSILREGTKRLVNFNQEFSPEAPFSFNLSSTELTGFVGEDFTLSVEIDGAVMPEKVYMYMKNGTKVRLAKAADNTFEYLISNPQEDIGFQLEASGFYSTPYTIQFFNRPDLVEMNILVRNPGYTGGEVRNVNNSGDLTVLEGSEVSWNITSQATDSLSFLLGEKTLTSQRNEEDGFVVASRVTSSSDYSIRLFNAYGSNASEISYNVSVIEDEAPSINVEYFPDTTLFQYVTLAGNIIDDHGFTSLTLNYNLQNEEGKKIPLELSKNVRKQSFYANWNVDTLNLTAGDRLEFYISVSDNDGVNGAKTTRSKTFIMEIPSEESIEQLLDDKSQTVENQIDKSKNNSEEINEQLKEIEERLKSKQELGWQEKKQLDDVIKDREKLQQQIEELQQQHKDLDRTNNQFNKRSESTQQQNEKLQSLLDELLDPETRELYEQLKELLKQKDTSADQVRQQLQDIRQNEQNLERELDRALELFKRLKMQNELEQNIQKLNELSEQQEELASQNEENADLSEISEEQQQIKEEFEKYREKMEEVEKMNQELKQPQAMQDYEIEERLIQRDLNEIKEQLEQQQEEGDLQKEGDEENEGQEEEQGDGQDPKGEEGEENEGEEQKGEQSEEQGNKEEQQQSGEEQQQSGQQSEQSRSQRQKQTKQQQQKAAQQMKQLSQKLSNMQSGMQMEMMQANLDQLRDILDNLVKLSFNQESLMTEMRSVNQSDPRFLELSQAQLKLKEDAKVIQDSLLSLAERVVQLSSFITREVGNINENIDEALDFLKDRNRGRALSSQQFAMTSINNLALLLDDTMQQMQMAMSEAMGNPSQGKQSQQKGLPDLQELQQQLGDQINELRESGKQGRELSEELARLAAQQELIRRQLQQIKEAQDGQPGGNTSGDDLQQAIEQMEQNEVDLVNKRLTRQLINRQQAIITRMLEAEKSQREQEMEEEREAESPSIFSREIPPQFEEYLKLRQKEIELLKTIPVELNPFYKKEVNDYFRRISSDTE